MCLNNSTSKILTWTVRVLHPRVLTYSYPDKKSQKQINATKFECFLVGANPHDYVMATIRHSSRDANFVDSQKQSFKDGTVWKISSVAIVATAAAQYNGAPNKSVVMLEAPTKMVAILHGSPEANKLATFIAPRLRLPDLLRDPPHAQ